VAKLTVITDSSGEIIGTADYTGAGGAPTLARVSAGPNTTAHEIDVPDDVLRLPPPERHLRIRQSGLLPVKVT
jgi:hypothetical protein